MDRFYEWITLKITLNGKEPEPPHVTEGDIWWASIGENVGSEIHGKSADFTRPVIIFKKLSHRFFFVILTTSKPHEGTWYVLFHQNGQSRFACLHQARAIDYRRLHSKLGSLDEKDIQKIQTGFKTLYIKQLSPTISGGVAGNPRM